MFDGILAGIKLFAVLRNGSRNLFQKAPLDWLQNGPSF